MTEDDAFAAYVSSLAGSAVAFVPGAGGFEDAVSALSFMELCDRHGVVLTPGDEAPAGGPTVFGSLEAAAESPRARGVVLPTSVDRPEALEPVLRSDMTLFLRDPLSLRLAELQGVPPEHRLLCRDLSEHLDLDALGVAPEASEGTLRVGFGGVPPGGGDGVVLCLSGENGRWRSPDRCRAAVRGVLALVGRHGTVVTDSVPLAVLAARLGRTVAVRLPPDGTGAAYHQRWIAPDHPRVVLGPNDDAAGSAQAGEATAADATDLRRLTAAERRDAQDRESLALRVAELQERLDAGFAAAVIAAERDPSGVRLLPASAVEKRLAERDAEVAALRSERDAEVAALRSGHDAEAEALRSEIAALRGNAEAAERRRAEEIRERDSAEAAATARAQAEATGQREVVAALEAALAARGDGLLALQGALDRATLKARVAESRIAQMRALIDQRGAAAAGAEAAERQARAQLARVTSSLSWRVTRPLRGVGRSLLRIGRRGRLRRA